MLILLIYLAILTKAVHIGCSDSSCTLVMNTTCIGICFVCHYAQPFTSNIHLRQFVPNTSYYLSLSYSYVSTAFFTFLSFSDSSIGNFQHPEGLPFSDPGEGSLIPTKDRGFYFSETSQLVSSVNCIFAPDFSIGFSIKILAPGTILTIVSGSSTQVTIQASLDSITVP